MMLVYDLAEVYFAHNSQLVNRSHNYRAASYDSDDSVECVRVLERADEYVHLRHESAQSWQTEVSHCRDYPAYSHEWHDSRQTAHLRNLSCVGSSVDASDKAEEQGCHQTV